MDNFAGILKKWTLAIDRGALSIVLAIISIGVWVSIASTPAVAVKLGLSPFYFVKQHLTIVPIGIITTILISFMRPNHIRRFSVIGYVACIFFLIAVILFGEEIKGAKRWISVGGFSLQPSEFLKPTIGVITAWLISEQYRDRKFPGIILSAACLIIAVPLLLLQPDVGMSVILVATWVGQLFASGISVVVLVALSVLAISSLFLLYFNVPHFANRVDCFLFNDGDTYQIQRSLEAFKNGGFWGKGPGEGIVKTMVPDAHSDFVFSVIGEEFGFALCFIIIIAFVALIIRSLSKVMKSSSLFSFVTIFGIVFQITVQVFINIATSINLIPTKGMTLPFISYGRSSFMATSISIGILLAITKNNSARREIL
jgi:cell division protein FtsW